MAVVADVGGQQSSSIVSQVPKPVLFGVLAAAVFLGYRAIKGGSDSSAGVPTNGQTLGLPNTAVMLGSIQEQLQNVLGAVGSDQANTTEIGKNLSDQLGGLSGQLGDTQTSLDDLASTLQINDQQIQDAIKAGSVPPSLSNTLETILGLQNKLLAGQAANNNPTVDTYIVHGVKDFTTQALSAQQALDIAIARAGYGFYGGPPPGGGSWFSGQVTNTRTGTNVNVSQ